LDTLFIPTQDDFKNCLREAVKDSLDISAAQSNKTATAGQEPLISRKDVRNFLGISLVTLNQRMKKGLPNHKVNGRFYFQRSEVLSARDSKTYYLNS